MPETRIQLGIGVHDSRMFSDLSVWRKIKRIQGWGSLMPHHPWERELRTPELTHPICTRIRKLLVTALRAFCFLVSLLTTSFPLPFAGSCTSMSTVAVPWGWLPGAGQHVPHRQALHGRAEGKAGAWWLPAPCRASTTPQEQLLFGNWLLLMIKRKHLNHGKHKLPKPVYHLSVIFLRWLGSKGWPFLSLQAALGRGANGGKEGFCMELSTLNNSKQLIVHGKLAFWRVYCFCSLWCLCCRKLLVLKPDLVQK